MYTAVQEAYAKAEVAGDRNLQRQTDDAMTSNRVFSLSELDRPFFRETVDAMKKLMEEFPGFYLHPSKQWEYPWALENATLGTEQSGSRRRVRRLDPAPVPGPPGPPCRGL